MSSRSAPPAIWSLLPFVPCQSLELGRRRFILVARPHAPSRRPPCSAVHSSTLHACVPAPSAWKLDFHRLLVIALHLLRSKALERAVAISRSHRLSSPIPAEPLRRAFKARVWMLHPSSALSTRSPLHFPPPQSIRTPGKATEPPLSFFVKASNFRATLHHPPIHFVHSSSTTPRISPEPPRASS